MSGIWLASYLVLWVLTLVTVVLVLGLARELGAIHRRFGSPGALMTDAGLDIGATAPAFTAAEVPSGREVTFHPTGSRDALLLFVAPQCGSGLELLPRLAAGWTEWQQRVVCAIACEGSEAEVQAFADLAGVSLPMLADPLAQIRGAYGHPPTPFGFLIDAAGIVKLKGIINSRDDVDRLIEGQARLLGGRTVVAAWNGNSETAGARASVKEACYGPMD